MRLGVSKNFVFEALRNVWIPRISVYTDEVVPDQKQFHWSGIYGHMKFLTFGFWRIFLEINAAPGGFLYVARHIAK